MTETHAPGSTYRLQLHRDFDFDAAAALAPYLAQLGIGAGYTSPILKARPGSRHGYDIVDHHEVSPELGGEDGFRRLATAFGAHGLGLVLDFVPNHMAADPAANPWWRDVLENGPSSTHARTFDIDWAPLKHAIQGRVLLPILGDQYGLVLERHELTLHFDDGAFEVRYFDHQLPVNPRQSTMVLRIGLEALQARLGGQAPEVQELAGIITGLDHLPPYMSSGAEQIEERARSKAALRQRLARLEASSPTIREHIARAVAAVSGPDGDIDLLHRLLDAQPYRLAYWRVAAHEINYRRFFDINDLAGVRMEEPEVFAATHGLLRRLLAEGVVHGIRIDHPDGLFDPETYFERLAGLVPERRPWIVAEKILSARERLPGWPVAGTTGYNFLNDVTGVFIRRSGAGRLRRVYRRVSAARTPLEDVIYDSKRLIMATSLASELNVLADSLDRLSEADRRSRDFTLDSLRDLLRETVACFPVYRTYVSARGFTAADQAAIEVALAQARRRNPAMESSIFAFLRGVLLPPGLPRRDQRAAPALPDRAADFDARLAFAMKLQQYSAPVQAKGVEDTAFYRYNTLLSLNEVGGDPGRFGRSAAEFHAANADRLRRRPFEMIATSTHDTKLGEDARMRVNVLAEIPDAWDAAVRTWQKVTAGWRQKVDGDWAPDGNDTYRLYQVLVACWPPAGLTALERGPLGERLQGYMAKALREAKQHTSWVSENLAYETAVRDFIARLVDGPDADRFVHAFEPFARRVAVLGAIQSLGQVVLKTVAPGVPDFYQGSEFWTLTLVDPDNRRPVDFAARRAALDALEPLLAGGPSEVLSPDALRAAWPDGRIKLFVTAAGLRLRQAHPDLFLSGGYLPLRTTLTVQADAVACARELGGRAVVAVVPRFVSAAGGGDPEAPLGAGWQWADSRVELPPGLAARTFRNVFTGERVVADQGGLHIGGLLARFPVALLHCPPE
jgi:(1->4)-alpha-D-glucan 1-alpha-D-glucosylmutase